MSRTFVAQYGGPCAGCDDGIQRGDLARYVDDQLVHEDCTNLPTPRAAEQACPVCHLTTCDCNR